MGDLPELPKPSIRVDAFGDILPTDGRRFVMGDFYTADQLLEAVRQEREACLTICAELHEHYSGYKDTALLNGDVELSNAASGEPRACEAIAAAIRARSEQ